MSVSEISSGNNLALYLLQQNQNAANQNAGSTSNVPDIFSTPAISALSESSDDGSDDGLYSESASTISAGAAAMNNFASDLESLLGATQSGDTTSAQTDAAALEQDLGISTSDTADSSTSPARTSAGSTDPSADQFITDLTSLISAVQSGDMTTAQTAADSVAKDLQAMAPPPPPPVSDISSGDTGSASAASSTSSSSATNAFKNFIDDLTSLLDATSSGDTTSAQTAATKVQADLQSLVSNGASASSAADSDATAGSPGTSSPADSSSQTALTQQQITQALINAIANSAQQTPMMTGVPPQS